MHICCEKKRFCLVVLEPHGKKWDVILERHPHIRNPVFPGLAATDPPHDNQDVFLLSNKASAFLLLTLLHHRHATTLVAAADDGWRSDLPWDTDLTSKLSPSASLLSTTPDNYLTECIPTFEVSWPYKTNHALINQPSGMCLPHLFCAFELCSPDPETDTVPLSERLEMTSDVNVDTLYSDLDGDIQDWIEDTSNSNYNLPSKVLFPVVASDIIAAVNFAKTHGLELSVKNSGHSYTAASTKKNTLLLNMNQYTRYASEGEGSIIDCDADSSSSSSSSNVTDLSDQPCLLSLAKGKPAVIRVGGGENWGECPRYETNEEERTRLLLIFVTTSRRTQLHSSSLCFEYYYAPLFISYY